MYFGDADVSQQFIGESSNSNVRLHLNAMGVIHHEYPWLWHNSCLHSERWKNTGVKLSRTSKLDRVLVHLWNQGHLDGAEVIPPSLFSVPPAAIEHIERRPKRRTEKSLQDFASDDCKYVYTYIYIRVRDVLNKYRSSCVLADEYSAGIKSRGLHFQSCYL